MSDGTRFEKMAEVIFKTFPPTKFKRLADIAGGKGHLQIALKKYNYQEVVTFDRRPRRATGTRYFNQLFTGEEKHKFDLLIGLHPDEATDVIIQTAVKKKVPFMVCPCCVKPSILKNLKGSSYRKWIHGLRLYSEKNGFSVETRVLKIKGKNILLIGRPSKK